MKISYPQGLVEGLTVVIKGTTGYFCVLVVYILRMEKDTKLP
jgi:hypothetical protein